MTNTKATKRALLSSVMALFLCFAMLLGTTYAWFTDSVTSAGNKIVAGTLDVELWMFDGKEYVNISESQAPIFGTGSIAQNNNAETLWEPGKTQVAYLQIKNNGSLALKYIVGLDVENVSQDLYKVMQYAVTPNATNDNPVKAWDASQGKNVEIGTQTVTESDTVMQPGEVHSFALSVHMDETAGDEYQDGKVNFDITVLATQATSESDSFGTDYDASATNPAIVRNVDDLKAAAAKGGNIMLGTDITVDGSLTLKAGATLNGNGNTLKNVQLTVGDGCTVENVVFDGTVTANGSSIYAHNASVTVKNCKFSNFAYEALQITQNAKADAEIVIDGCTFSGGGVRYIHVESTVNELKFDNNTKITITNNTFNNIDLCTDDGICMGWYNPENYTFSGNVASAVSEEAAKGELFIVGLKTETENLPMLDLDVFERIDIVTAAADEASLKNAILSGGAVMLTKDIVMGATLPISDANFELDGNGHTITMSDECTNTYALFDITRGKATIKNVTFDGIKEGAIVRTVSGVEFNADNVTAVNGNHTQVQGIFRLLGKSTITNCTFKNNTCNMVISLNYDGANNDPQVVKDCVFENNTCNATAVIYYVKGAGCTLDGNKFVKNTVTVTGSSNAATVYMGFTEGNTIINNVFEKNTVNAGTSRRAAGALMLGNAAVVKNNAFIDNKVIGERAIANDVCASAYYAEIDLSGNYWGGGAPVENDNYYNEYPEEYDVVINDYLTTYSN